MKYLMLFVLAVLTGCAATEALRHDVTQVKEKQHSMKTLILDYSKKLDAMDADFNELLKAADAQAAAQEKGLTDFYARIQGELTDRNRTFSNTLDQSVLMATEKAKAEDAQLRIQHARDLKTITGQLEALEKRMDALEKTLDGMSSGKTADPAVDKEPAG